MMKKIAILWLGLAIVALAKSDLSGIWDGKGGRQTEKYGSIAATAQLTLLQAGDSVKGTLKIGNGTVMTITSGVVSGSAIRFNVGTEKEGILGSVELTRDGSTLRGQVSMYDGRVFDMVFTTR